VGVQPAGHRFGKGHQIGLETKFFHSQNQSQSPKKAQITSSLIKCRICPQYADPASTLLEE
jgi:hypothetical protein